ncbi:sperm-associated antigen 7 isoform X2 [Aphidius gifuensis]|uniref:sperm-associated antigen 7 isoform X2 n=1 Tax=Aphidius gifuensis TaxID=684658 RepID=UPI001CDC4DF7|nr:sperm-associated antigen 7 isoform X2 [Aphidius gifuensis]
MDLLGSILKSMDKPPQISDKQKALIKKQREDHAKFQKIEAEKHKRFREQVEETVGKFLKNGNAKEYKFPPMDQVHRSIVHESAEVASVLAYTFGEEGVDRYIIIFKREHAPSEDQLSTLRRGEEWNDEIAKKLQHSRAREAIEAEEEEKSRKRKLEFVPTSDYKQKYEHLIGKDAALEAARKTEANSNYGCVPSENKKDQRSIEQTLADIRAKKQKLASQNEKSSAYNDPNNTTP